MPEKIERIAGVDLAYDKDKNIGFCVVVNRPALPISKQRNIKSMVS